MRRGYQPCSVQLGTLQSHGEVLPQNRDLFYTGDRQMRPEQFESWLTVDARGLYCRPGGFHIDPHAGAKRAVITHGHSDHARPGHDHVLATRETLAVMKTRLGAAAPRSTQ